MNRHQIDHDRQQLEALIMRLRDDVTAVAETALGPSRGQISGELSDAPTHLGDRGSEEYMTEMNELLLENQQHIMTESRAALERIEAGTYGRCENCGQEIGRQWLEALPYTRFCVQCASKTDFTPQVNLNSGRPTGPPRR
jgi:DnaK suppressor protein